MRPILLAGTTDEFARRLNAAVDEGLRDRVRLWPHSLTAFGAVEAALEVDPVVVVIGPGLAVPIAFRLAGEIDAERPDIGVIVVCHDQADAMEEALAVGVRGVLSGDADPDAIRSTVARAVNAAERHARGPDTPSSVVAKARVTTVVSPKGGAGKTVLSTNLAVGLAQGAPRGVVIVDLDLQFGDVGYALGLRPRHTIFDAISTSGQLDMTTLKVFLAHHRSDLYALCAPDEPARGEMIEVESVQRIITLLAAEFEVLELPDELRCGLFAEPRRFDAWVRFGGPGPRVVPDIRDNGVLSLGVKVLGVPGETLLDDETHTQDFSGISAPTFTTPDVHENAKLQLAEVLRRRGEEFGVVRTAMGWGDSRDAVGQQIEDDVRNNSWYSNPEVDALLEEALVSTDMDVRRKNYEKASVMVMEDAGGIFVYNTKWFGPFNKQVKGVRFTPIGDGQEVRWMYPD